MKSLRRAFLALGILLSVYVLVAGRLHFSLSLILLQNVPSHLQWGDPAHHLNRHFPNDQRDWQEAIAHTERNGVNLLEKGGRFASMHNVHAAVDSHRDWQDARSDTERNRISLLEEGGGFASMHNEHAGVPTVKQFSGKFLNQNSVKGIHFSESQQFSTATKATGGARQKLLLKGVDSWPEIEPQHSQLTLHSLGKLPSGTQQDYRNLRRSSEKNLPDAASRTSRMRTQIRDGLKSLQAGRGSTEAKISDTGSRGKGEFQETGKVENEGDLSTSDLRGWSHRIESVLTVSAKGDGSCGGFINGGVLECGRHGVCRQQRCRCVQAYTGERCEIPKSLPLKMSAAFEGRFALSKREVLDRGGVFAVSNPKAGDGLDGSGGLRNVSARLSLSPADDVRALAALRDGHLSSVPEMITPGLAALMPEDDVLAGLLFDTCAIVGNSGLNLHYLHGQDIDRHNAVFRFNSAPLEGIVNGQRVDYRPHVGKRTTFRLVNSAHTGSATGEEIRLQQVQSKSGLFKYLQHIYDHPQSNIVAFDTDFTAYVSRNLPLLPTGGFFALLLALQKCMEVDVYGFYWQPGQAIPHHYFNSEAPLTGKDTVHDYELEFNKLNALAKEGVVRLQQPCVIGCEAETGIACATCAPGSTCACVPGLPSPVALPGFCHTHGNYSCFYPCPTCKGGPHDSQCPFDFDPTLPTVTCTTKDDISPMSQANLPHWALPSQLSQQARLPNGGENPKGEKQALDKGASSLEDLELLFD